MKSQTPLNANLETVEPGDFIAQQSQRPVAGKHREGKLQARHFWRRELAAGTGHGCCGNPCMGARNLPVPSRSRFQPGPDVPFPAGPAAGPRTLCPHSSMQCDKNTRLLATSFSGEGGIVAEAILEDGLGNAQFSRELLASAGRRLVAE